MASRKALRSEAPSAVGLNFRLPAEAWRRRIPGGGGDAPSEVPAAELTRGWKPWACAALASSRTFPLEKKGMSPRMRLKQECGGKVTWGA